VLDSGVKGSITRDILLDTQPISCLCIMLMYIFVCICCAYAKKKLALNDYKHYYNIFL
jgi:hypothetical protein